MAWVIAVMVPPVLLGAVYLSTRPGSGELPLFTGFVVVVTYPFVLLLLVHRNRPIVKIEADGVTIQSAFRLSGASNVPLPEIARVSAHGSVMTLLLKSGKRRRVRIMELSYDARDSAIKELKRRVADAAS